MTIDLDHEESELLEGLLERCLVDLREEIFHTDRSVYKADLKADEALMKSILAKLAVHARSA